MKILDRKLSGKHNISLEALTPLRKLISNQQIRFLIVGGFNTVLGFLTFSLFQYLFGKNIGYIGCLIFSFILVTTFSFYIYRTYVFTTKVPLITSYLKYQSINSVSLLVNLLLLPAIIIYFSLNPYISQAISIFIISLLSYLGHRFYSFKSNKNRNTTPKLSIDFHHLKTNKPD